MIALLISNEPLRALGMARRWVAAGTDVQVVLLDEAAAAVRSGHPAQGLLRELQDAGAAVSVHDDALRRRGVDPATVGLKIVELDEIADLVAEGAGKVVWW